MCNKKEEKKEYLSFLADINGLQYRSDGDRMTIAMTGTRKMTTVWDAFDQKYMGYIKSNQIIFNLIYSIPESLIEIDSLT